jgi:hypothetical protein
MAWQSFGIGGVKTLDKKRFGTHAVRPKNVAWLEKTEQMRAEEWS